MAYPLAGVAGDVWITATPSVTATNESCTDSGDHINYTAATHIFWDWTQTFTVQNSPNGSSSWVTVTDYTFQWAVGKVVFNTARTPGVNNFTRISTGNYFTATQLDASHDWSLALKMTTKDITAFQATGAWMANLAILKEGSGKIETYRNEDRISKEFGNQLGMQLFIDKTNNVRWQFFATATGVDTKSDVNSVETQTISFVNLRDIYLLLS
jgi:hypothetical protein